MGYFNKRAFCAIRGSAFLVLSAVWLAPAIGRARAESARLTGAADRAAPVCRLLSRAEVERIIGAAVADGRPQLNTGVLTTCVFTVHGGGRISVLLRSDVQRNWIVEQTRSMAHGVQSGRFRSIAGLGDRAFLFGMRQSAAALCIFRGEYYLQITALTGDVASAYTAAEMVARRVLSRLEAPQDALRVARAAR